MRGTLTGTRHAEPHVHSTSLSCFARDRKDLDELCKPQVHPRVSAVSSIGTTDPIQALQVIWSAGSASGSRRSVRLIRQNHGHDRRKGCSMSTSTTTTSLRPRHFSGIGQIIFGIVSPEEDPVIMGQGGWGGCEECAC